ncbi:ABC-transporter-regulating transcription factor-like protein [Cladobotryum mycophilum]|uniref:ABC-transporter-regulating transcription factor-like protein n=1 Tax=Cladobotryum mycophilum TaxID=491253 RepID=A0ABR0SIK8_9HYPO
MVAQKRACDACHKRKCDTSEGWSECNWCHHQGTQCSYTRVRGRKRRLKTNIGSQRNLVEQIESIGQALASTSVVNKEESQGSSPEHGTAVSTPGSRNSEPNQPIHRGIQNHSCPGCQVGQSEPVSHPYFRRLNTAVLGQIYFAGQNLGTLCSRNGFPHLTARGEQWIYSRTGQLPSFQRLSLSYSPDPHHDDHHTEHLPPVPTEPPQVTQGQRAVLPERWVTEYLLQAFLETDFSLVFPLVERVLFQQTIRLAYCSRGSAPTLEQKSAKACVLMFLAIGGCHFREQEAASYVDSDACAKEAQSLLAEVLEDVSVTTLQTAIMLVLHETLCGRLQSMSMYHALGCRIVFSLGGHAQAFSLPKDHPMTLQDREDRHVRVLFWLCYVFDKDIALRTGQPPIITDDFCDLTLPEGYIENRFLLHDGASTKLDDHPPCIVKKSDAELLRTIRELDEELERWRVSVPPEFSPLLYVSKNVRLAPDLSEARSMLHIELTLDYHYLVNVIHSASGRCASDWNGPGKERSFGVQSSLDLSVEASRSTLIYLSAAGHRLAGEAFWAFIFYPMSAVMTLFFNILRNPLGEHAMHDMDLLNTASNVIRSMPMRRVTFFEMTYLRQAHEFIVELNRLSRCAMTQSHEAAKAVTNAT